MEKKLREIKKIALDGEMSQLKFTPRLKNNILLEIENRKRMSKRKFSFVPLLLSCFLIIGLSGSIYIMLNSSGNMNASFYDTANIENNDDSNETALSKQENMAPGKKNDPEKASQPNKNGVTKPEAMVSLYPVYIPKGFKIKSTNSDGYTLVSSENGEESIDVTTRDIGVGGDHLKQVYIYPGINIMMGKDGTITLVKCDQENLHLINRSRLPNVEILKIIEGHLGRSDSIQTFQSKDVAVYLDKISIASEKEYELKYVEQLSAEEQIEVYKEKLIGLSKQEVEQLLGPNYQEIDDERLGDINWRYDFSNHRSYLFYKDTVIDADKVFHDLGMKIILFIGWDKKTDKTNFISMYYKDSNGDVQFESVSAEGNFKQIVNSSKK